jgi:hypothetical protein
MTVGTKGTPMSERDDDSSPGLVGVLLLAAWFLAALLFAALPLGAGVVVACVVPGLGGIRSGLSIVAVIGLLVTIVAGAAIIDERPVRAMQLLLAGRPRLQRPAAELLVFALLSIAFLAPLASLTGAVTAAAVASAGYRCLEPLVQRSEERRR